MADAEDTTPINVKIKNLDVGIRHVHTLRGQEQIGVGQTLVTQVTKSMGDGIANDSPRNYDDEPMFEVDRASDAEVREALGLAPKYEGEKPLDQESLTKLKKIAKEEGVDVSKATTAPEYADAIEAHRAAAQ